MTEPLPEVGFHPQILDQEPRVSGLMTASGTPDAAKESAFILNWGNDSEYLTSGATLPPQVLFQADPSVYASPLKGGRVTHVGADAATFQFTVPKSDRFPHGVAEFSYPLRPTAGSEEYYAKVRQMKATEQEKEAKRLQGTVAGGGSGSRSGGRSGGQGSTGGPGPSGGTTGEPPENIGDINTRIYAPHLPPELQDDPDALRAAAEDAAAEQYMNEYADWTPDRESGIEIDGAPWTKEEYETNAGVVEVFLISEDGLVLRADDEGKS